MQVLRPIQSVFNPADHPDLLVGLTSPDDAAVWKIDDNRGLVLTTDFFTPVVDDPFDYGRIAAANSLSDIYAMGGKPFLALNIAALPPELDSEIGAEIIRGGAEVAKKAGVVIAGGHTIQDKEPKYGLVAAGFVDIHHMFRKSDAKPGDLLYLTKPLGFGTVTTALKQQKAYAEDVEEVISWMTRLNDVASEVAQRCGVRGATDITGFSFLGHAAEMALAGKVKLEIVFSQLPILDIAEKYAQKFIFPGGAYDNQLFFDKFIHWEIKLKDEQKLIAFDPQTSGGLLLAVPSSSVEDFERLMTERAASFWRVGSVEIGEGVTVQ